MQINSSASQSHTLWQTEALIIHAAPVICLRSDPRLALAAWLAACPVQSQPAAEAEDHTPAARPHRASNHRRCADQARKCRASHRKLGLALRSPWLMCTFYAYLISLSTTLAGRHGPCG